MCVYTCVRKRMCSVHFFPRKRMFSIRPSRSVPISPSIDFTLFCFLFFPTLKDIARRIFFFDLTYKPFPTSRRKRKQNAAEKNTHIYRARETEEEGTRVRDSLKKSELCYHFPLFFTPLGSVYDPKMLPSETPVASTVYRHKWTASREGNKKVERRYFSLLLTEITVHKIFVFFFLFLFCFRWGTSPCPLFSFLYRVTPKCLSGVHMNTFKMVPLNCCCLYSGR